MTKRLLILTGCVLATFFHLAHATVDQIVQKAGPKVVMGVIIEDGATGRTVYSHNADRLFLPASSIKIFTAAASLILLGPNFHFPTSVYTDAPSIQPGVLNGNLYVTFSGDPTLTSSNVVEVLSTLKTRGITQINGNVVVVFPAYEDQKYPPGAAEGDRLHPYGAPVTPVIIDQNAMLFTISTTGAGQLTRVSLSDPSGRVRLSNLLYTKRPNSRGCGLSYHIDETNLLSVKGCVRPQKSPYVERIPVSDPGGYAEGIVNMAIRHHGVNIQGKVVRGIMPTSAKLLNTHSSEALPIILKKTLGPSNNVFANALYLKVGQVYWRKMATWQNSGLAVKELLEKYAHVSMKSATFMDGAGLSRSNRVTPRQGADVLYQMKQKFLLSDDFISALPTPGERGTTLAHRYIAPYRLQKNIHAKTGTMKGIVGFVGYLPSANHHTLIFSMLINAATPLVYTTDKIYLPLWKYRALEDEICRYLMNLNV